MNNKNIIIKNEGKLGILKISRPKEKNSLNIETANEIYEALKNFQKNKAINCVIILGDKGIFSTGADINELDKLNSKTAKKKKLFDSFDKIEKIKIPLISAVEGYALGGGLELALISDFIIASKDAKFGQPEINLGLIPGIGGTQRLKSFIGKFHANFLCMSGEIINSTKAYEIGMVSKILNTENFELEAIKFVKNISDKPKKSLVEIKKLTKLDLNLFNGIKKERNSFYKLLDSENKDIGIKSFFNKNNPEWKD
jgi:enoyl-CoA hydratase